MNRLVLMLLLCLGLTGAVQAERHALLIGVGDYQNPRVRDLKGPPYDIEVMKRYALEGWKVRPDKLTALVDAQASKARILQAIDQLSAADGVQSGDQVLIYFSGHGTSRFDAGLDLPIAHGSGAFMPWDTKIEGSSEAIKQSLVVGNVDLKPRLMKLDQKGADVLVIMDACYSGNSVRSTRRQKQMQPRYQPIIVTDDEFSAAEATADVRADEVPKYPYRTISYLSAASDREKAMDVSDPQKTFDGKPHGAFTDALVRILNGEVNADSDGDGQVSNSELRLTTLTMLEKGHYGHVPQTLPSAEDDPLKLASRSLLEVVRAPGPSRVQSAAPDLAVHVAGDLAGLTKLVGEESGMVLESGNYDVKVEPQGGQWLLTSGPGDWIGQVPSGDLGKAMYRLRQLRWLHRVQQHQLNGNGFNLSLDIVPGSRGGTFKFGEYLTFRFDMQRSAWLMVLDIDSGGKIVPLYPFTPAELKKLPAGKALYVPAEDPKRSIQVGPPCGTDHIVAIAYEAKPDMLDRLVGREEIAPNDPLMASLETLISKPPAGVAVALSKLRVVNGEGQCSQ